MQRKSFQTQKNLSIHHSKVSEKSKKGASNVHAKLTSATMSKRPIFLNHARNMEMEIFASINKRKIKWFFLYFSRKYEAHKVAFSKKETNLLGRGYGISFQKKNFRDFTKKPKLNYVFSFIYDNAKDFWIWAQTKNQTHKN